jgi:hypothetical protein
MSWSLFIDESGQDRGPSPYEVLAGVAVEDRRIWPLIRQLSDLQQHHFGMRLFEAYGHEAKATKLLNSRSFKHANQLDPIPVHERTKLAHEILADGTAVSKRRLTALGQAKVAYCLQALDIARHYGAVGFAMIVPRDAPRPETAMLRKDYAFLFERFFYFLHSQPNDAMGYLVFDERDKSESHLLLSQVGQYFIKTQNGRTRSRLIIPEPFFVHSDLTSLVQLADIIAYVVSWGVRLAGMTEPSRPELANLAEHVLRLQFHHETGEVHRGFKLIRDLRPALKVAEEKDAIAQYGSADAGASLGDILGAALKARDPKK